jgi:hypothetical protein
VEETRAISEAAHLVYHKIWLEDGLNQLLQPVPGRNLKYLSNEHIDSLQLERLSYNEPVLLIREEYGLACEYLQSQEGLEQRVRKGGMVVTGQPGIGAHFSPARSPSLTIVSSRNIQSREVLLLILSPVSPLEPEEECRFSNRQPVPSFSREWCSNFQHCCSQRNASSTWIMDPIRFSSRF